MCSKTNKLRKGIYMRFGDNLKKIRKEKNISKKHLAKRLNISVYQISTWESGKNYPNFFEIQKISQSLQCDINALVYKKLSDFKSMDDEIKKYVSKSNSKRLYRYCVISLIIIFILVFSHSNIISYFSKDVLENKVVACIGDSITYGYGVEDTRDTDSYPSILAKLLGDNYTVINYGVNNTTLQKSGNEPYIYTDDFLKSLENKPDIVLIMLGTNDSKGINWNKNSSKNYKKDYIELIREYKKANKNASIYAIIPPKIFAEVTNNNQLSINDKIIQNEIIKIIKEIAEEENIKIVDLYKKMEKSPELIPDKIHPNRDGNQVIAEELYKAINNGK